MKDFMNTEINQGVSFGAKCSFCKNKRVCARFYHQYICEECSRLATQMIQKVYQVGDSQ